jgi:hypothetical protein
MGPRSPVPYEVVPADSTASNDPAKRYFLSMADFTGVKYKS